VCACGHAWRETERASVLYDGSTLSVVTGSCDGCGAERTLYFRPAKGG